MIRVEVDPPDPNNPTLISVSIVMAGPTDAMIGKSVGELRCVGMVVPGDIPNCAIVGRAEDGGWKFSWVRLHCTIASKDGKISVTPCDRGE